MLKRWTAWRRSVRWWLAGIGVLVLLAGGAACGGAASAPAPAAAASVSPPASIENLVLQAGPAAAAHGSDNPRIATRGEDPAPLSTAEIAEVFPPGKGTGPSQVSANCAGAVTGQAVVRALRAAGCTQVLREIATCTGTGGPYTGLIDIFNLASGTATYQAARAFGEDEPNTSIFGPNVASGGFILPWAGTSAAGVASAANNAADVDAFGHFLVVLWTYSSDNPDIVDGAGNCNGLFELHLSQFADNRAGALRSGQSGSTADP